MPIRPPALDDRGFDDLVDEMLRRIPAHTPEWTNPRLGDPGRTLIDLFAWLGDTILYRANRIPERQRLAFLRLLGQRMRPATPARGMVAVHLKDKAAVAPVHLRESGKIQDPVAFETEDPLSVMPVRSLVFHRRRPDGDELTRLGPLIAQLEQLYKVAENESAPYITTSLFAAGLDAAGWTPADSIDGSLWLALVAGDAENVTQVRRALGGADPEVAPLLNVGIVPRIEVPDPLADRAVAPPKVAVEWTMTTGGGPNRPAFVGLDPLESKDGTAGLTRSGVVRLRLPRGDFIGAPGNEVTEDDIGAGTEERPPRVDDPDVAARIVTWLRMRPRANASVSLSWVGVNAVSVVQRRTVAGMVIGVSDGGSDQVFSLTATGVQPASLELEVAAPGERFRQWRVVDDVGAYGREDEVYELDPEAGTVRFGDGVAGRVPLPGSRVRVRRASFGGGAAGNLAPGTLKSIRAVDIRGRNQLPPLVVEQPLPTSGGDDAESLERAEKRIPAFLRHRDRAVTAEDYRALASATPGVPVGRVEVLPRFRPQSRLEDVPGVVSVMVLPDASGHTSPNPRPDRPFLERVHAQLERRRPLATELYTIGCEYVPLGLAVGIDLRSGHDPSQVVHDVKEALRSWLWPLAPGGVQGEGWPLGRAVESRELEVVVARVTGVSGVRGVELFAVSTTPALDPEAPPAQSWTRRPPVAGSARIDVKPYQLPELLSVVVVSGEEAPKGLPSLLGHPFDPESDAPSGFAIPVVPEVC